MAAQTRSVRFQLVITCTLLCLTGTGLSTTTREPRVSPAAVTSGVIWSRTTRQSMTPGSVTLTTEGTGLSTDHRHATTKDTGTTGVHETATSVLNVTAAQRLVLTNATVPMTTTDYTGTTTSTPITPVRLVGGADWLKGRLEVRHEGVWGTVCKHYFNDDAAKVVCRMLGLANVGLKVTNTYGAGDGPILLDNVECNGAEADITQCSHNGWGVHNCRHSYDVAVSCLPVRLADGPSLMEGRVEVLYNGTWGTVCKHYFDDNAASVVCSSLDFGPIGREVPNTYGRGDGPILLDNVKCNGTEPNITQCSHNGWGVNNCGHSDDVAVSCIQPTTATPPDIPVRLVGGSSELEGRVEVYYDGEWGTVCQHYFNDAAARVVCYSLGYGRVGREVPNTYGSGDGPILLDNVKCGGTEPNITQCSHNVWGDNNCRHSDDVAVSCVQPTSTYHTATAVVSNIVEAMTSASPDNSTASGNTGNSGLSRGEIAAIIVVVCLVVILAVCVIAVVWRNCRGDASASAARQSSQPNTYTGNDVSVAYVPMVTSTNGEDENGYSTVDFRPTSHAYDSVPSQTANTNTNC